MVKSDLPIIGALNIDTPNEVYPKGFHKDAKNIIFRGKKGSSTRIENINGTREIINGFLPTLGVNTTIGTYFDVVKNRVFYFNYNSQGYHAIYILNQNETIQTLIQSTIANDVLNFDANGSIDSIDILYNDDVDGDILYFIDTLKRPTQINIPRYLANTYGTIKRSYINVIKAPPSIPIKCVYENDFTVTQNNLRGKLFQFIYRFVYDNLEKSVWSSGSEVPLPFLENVGTSDRIASNARINLFFETGDASVKKIEIAFRQAANSLVSDYFTIDVLDKEKLSIPNDTFTNYLFFNDGVYIPVNTKEQVLDFDYVPKKANAGVLLNGNIPAYAGIEEGYDLIAPNTTLSTSSSDLVYQSNGLLFFAYQGNDVSQGTGKNLTIVITGFSEDNDVTDPTLSNTKGSYYVKVIDGNNNDVSIDFNIPFYNGRVVTDIFTIIKPIAFSKGWSLVSENRNSITFNYPDDFTLQSSYVLFNKEDIKAFYETYDTYFANNYSSVYRYGIVYRDEDGRTNGVITPVDSKLVTVTDQQALDTYIPNMQLNIYHKPPIWAKYYHIVGSKNLTYAKQLNWVSKGAYADIPTSTTTRYAYIDISNIIDYNNDLVQSSNKMTDGVVSYDFSQGDRIKFIKRFAYNGTGTLLTAKQYDYEIVGVTNNIIANNTSLTGVFLKIKYPTNDISVDFDFNGLDYQNYKVFIYSYQSTLSSDKTTYFEFGQRRKVGNWGTNLAYHIGNIQSQNPTNLSIPSIDRFTQGDKFWRTRSIPVGEKYKVRALQNDQDTNTYIVTALDNAPISTSKYTLRNQPDAGFGVLVETASLFKNTSGLALNVNLNFTIPVINTFQACSFVVKAYIDSGGGTSNTILVSGSVDFNVVKYFPVNVNLTVPNNQCLALTIEPTSPVSFNALVYNNFDIELKISRNNITIPIIDNSYSDLLKLELNNYSKPQVVDDNAKKEYKKTLFRFAEPREQGTNINLSNRFYPNNTDEFDRQYGAVLRMTKTGRNVTIWQESNTGVISIYGNFIKDKSGTENLITTDSIITPNNIQYYSGGYAIRTQQTAICQINYVYYFADIIKGVLCRLSQDGITPISEIYNIQTWANKALTAYQTNSNYDFGGTSKILIAYNQFPDKSGEVIFMLQKGLINDGTVVDKPPYTLSWDEETNSFTSFYDFNSDRIICMSSKLLTFKNGVVYAHDDAQNKNSFYGAKYPSYIKFVMADGGNYKKEFCNIGYNANDYWLSETIGDVETSLGQQSNIVQTDYDYREGMYTAPFQRAYVVTQPDSVFNGDYLKGEWVSIKLSNNSSSLAFLQGAYINILDSPKNY